MTPNPTSRADLLALAERVEQASGPDRELDAEIAAATGALYGPRHKTYIESRTIEYIEESALRYTASLDAAMRLVPEDGFGSLIAGKWPDGSTGFVAVVTKPSRAEAEARTPALALTAAALRTQATQGEGS
jgi:hypothetical protein